MLSIWIINESEREIGILLSLFIVSAAEVRMRRKRRWRRGRAAWHPSCQSLPRCFSCLTSSCHAFQCCQATGATGWPRRGSRTGNRKSWGTERKAWGWGAVETEEPPSVRAYIPALREWQREKMGSWSSFTWWAERPNYLSINKGGSFATLGHRSALLLHLPSHLPASPAAAATTQQELPLSLFCHQMRGVQTRRSPCYDSARCHLWKAASPLNTLTSMKGRHNSGSHTLHCFLSLVFLFVWSWRLPAPSRPLPSVIWWGGEMHSLSLLTQAPRSCTRFWCGTVRLYRFGLLLTFVLLSVRMKNAQLIACFNSHCQTYCRCFISIG